MPDELCVMPLTDYSAACAAVRSKTGKSDLIKSGELADEIDSIVVGGGGGQIADANIAIGVGMNPGYLSTDGVPQAQDATKQELYSDEIDVSEYAGQKLSIYVLTANDVQHWVGYCMFDENHSFVSPRTAVQPAANTNCCGFSFLIPATGVKYIRITFRTYGDAKYALSVGNNVYSAIGEDGFCSYPEVNANA